MPSFRAISLFFVASLASLSFASAAPQYTPPAHVHYEVALAKAAKVTADTIKPIVDEMTDCIDGATEKIKTHVDAKVDLKVALAADAGEKLQSPLMTLLTLCLAWCGLHQGRPSGRSQGELDVVIKLFATLCVRLALLVQVCCQLVAGLAFALALHFTASVALCGELYVSACVDFLKVAA
ncbi:hypothetical protein PQX77_011502 [Marasmius sp. AFHP31]|nr:hypothetical protein PQX77_011502 [Marasmius sp. AFHP31]